MELKELTNNNHHACSVGYAARERRCGPAADRV